MISNRADAGGLDRARQAGIETLVMPHGHHADRETYDRALVDALKSRSVDLVCLAGFMRLLTSVFVDAFPHAIVNVHPSLLPAFSGAHAQRRAWAHGVKVSGVTVHLVDAELDAGPIVLQAAVPVEPEDTADTLAARILVEEHRILPEAIGILLDGGWTLDGRRFIAARR